MYIHTKWAGTCENGFPTFVPDLYDKVHTIIEKEGYDILKPTKSTSFYNDFSGKEKAEDKVLEWEFSLKVAKTTPKTQTKKKAPAKTNLTKETKSATVTQEDQQEDSESVE